MTRTRLAAEFTQPQQMAVSKPHRELRVGLGAPPPRRLPRPSGEIVCDPADILQLAGPENSRMAGRDLFGERRPRAGHSDDEDRQFRGAPSDRITETACR